MHRALSARRPRLRYVVGSGAKVMIGLRRYVPGELFQRAYARQLVRMVTRPRAQAGELSDASPRPEGAGLLQSNRALRLLLVAGVTVGCRMREGRVRGGRGL